MPNHVQMVDWFVLAPVHTHQEVLQRHARIIEGRFSADLRSTLTDCDMKVICVFMSGVVSFVNYAFHLPLELGSLVKTTSQIKSMK